MSKLELDGWEREWLMREKNNSTRADSRTICVKVLAFLDEQESSDNRQDASDNRQKPRNCVTCDFFVAGASAMNSCCEPTDRQGFKPDYPLWMAKGHYEPCRCEIHKERDELQKAVDTYCDWKMRNATHLTTVPEIQGLFELASKGEK